MLSNLVLTLFAVNQPQEIFLATHEEPYFTAALDGALANSHTDISPWQDPEDWLHADTNQITSITQVFAASTQSAEIEETNFGRDMIYPVCLIARTFQYVI